MANFKLFATQAKKLVDQAGGPEALKDKAGDLKKIATGKGTVADKAKAALAAVREDQATATEGDAAEADATGEADSKAPPRRQNKQGRGGGGRKQP